MEIAKANDFNHYEKIEDLAYAIIPEFYADVIPHEHNIFFVQKFQTAQAIEEQTNKGYEYYLLMVDALPIGYFGLQIDPVASIMFLSKLYLLKAHRGMGYGTMAMDFIMDRSSGLGLEKTILTVNRKNGLAIRLYEKYGFEITKELVNTFENGHTILDYEMTRITKI